MRLKVVEPTELSEIPLQSYQQWIKVSQSTNDQELLMHKFVQIFLGLKLSDAVQIKAYDIQRFIGSLGQVLKQKPEFKQTFTFNGIEFGFIPDLQEISWGEYMDIEQNLTNWETYHIALSVLYRPIKKRHGDTYEIMEYKGDTAFHELFKMIGMDIALSASVFFWNLERALYQDIQLYLKEERIKMSRETREMLMSLVKDPNLISNGDGTIASTDYQEEMYLSSMKLSGYPFIKPLPFSPMKSRKIRYNTMSKKGN